MRWTLIGVHFSFLRISSKQFDLGRIGEFLRRASGRDLFFPLAKSSITAALVCGHSLPSIGGLTSGQVLRLVAKYLRCKIDNTASKTANPKCRSIWRSIWKAKRLSQIRVRILDLCEFRRLLYDGPCINRLQIGRPITWRGRGHPVGVWQIPNCIGALRPLRIRRGTTQIGSSINLRPSV